MDLISIVVPCYNEQETVPIFYKKLEEVKQKMPLVEFEYWFIDDGSSDDSEDYSDDSVDYGDGTE